MEEADTLQATLQPMRFLLLLNFWVNWRLIVWQGNIVDISVEIPQKFHTSVIGSKGCLIRAIQDDCGGVEIHFPTGPKQNDVVTIHGPKNDAEKARLQLLELTNEKVSLVHLINVYLTNNWLDFNRSWLCILVSALDSGKWHFELKWRVFKTMSCSVWETICIWLWWSLFALTLSAFSIEIHWRSLFQDELFVLLISWPFHLLTTDGRKLHGRGEG